MDLIWVTPVLALVLATAVVGSVARRVEREVAGTAAAVDRAVTALGGVNEEMRRAKAHLERLDGMGRRPVMTRRWRRRPVPSDS